MISHQFCRDHLGEYLDETLDETRRREVETHLESCVACAQVAREMATIRATLRDFQPAPAPENLRANVRAALQNEATARLQKPDFAAPRGLPSRGFRWPQLAWSGTLALGALALIVLARPFAQTPIEAPTSAFPPASNEALKGEIPASAPLKKPETAQNTASDSAAQRRNETALQPHGGAQKAAPQNTNEPNRAASKSAADPSIPGKNQRQAAADRIASNGAVTNRENSVLRRKEAPAKSPSVMIAPIEKAPRFQPITPAPGVSKPESGGKVSENLASALAQKRAPAPNTSDNLPSPETSLEASPDLNAPSARSAAPFPATSAAPAPITPPKFARKSAPPSASNSSNRDEAHQLSSQIAPQNSVVPSFDLRLRAVPAPQIARSSPMGGLLPDKNLSAARADALESRRGVLESRAQSEGGRGGAGGAPQLRAQSGLNQFNDKRAAGGFAPGNARADARANAPASGAASALPEGAVSSLAIRRFELSFAAPQLLKSLSVRLELPENVRLLWPTSRVIWRGDFAPGNPLVIPFSLGQTRGGEKISVIVEQKSKGGQSKVLESQTLILPPAP